MRRLGSILLSVGLLACSGREAPRNGPPTAPGPAPRHPLALTNVSSAGAELLGCPDVEFEAGQAIIEKSPHNEMALGMLLRFLLTYGNITRVRVEIHTDGDGDPADNRRLSDARAIAIVAWLTDHGVAEGRLHPVGCASRDPLFPDDTPEHKARNNRMELDVEEVDGAPVDERTAPCTPNPFRHGP